LLLGFEIIRTLWLKASIPVWWNRNQTGKERGQKRKGSNLPLTYGWRTEEEKEEMGMVQFIREAVGKKRGRLTTLNLQRTILVHSS